jgi:hypothetical protein
MSVPKRYNVYLLAVVKLLSVRYILLVRYMNVLSDLILFLNGSLIPLRFNKFYQLNTRICRPSTGPSSPISFRSLALSFCRLSLYTVLHNFLVNKTLLNNPYFLRGVQRRNCVGMMNL